jgi:hypothetical protein
MSTNNTNSTEIIAKSSFQEKGLEEDSYPDSQYASATFARTNTDTA